VGAEGRGRGFPLPSSWHTLLHYDLPLFSPSRIVPYPVVVSASSDDGAGVGLRGVVRADADGVDVPTLVRLDPPPPDDLVDLVHLLPMEAHDGSIKGTMVLAQVTAG